MAATQAHPGPELAPVPSEPDVGLRQILSPSGELIGEDPMLDPDLLRRAYRLMVTLRVIDQRALNLQRQGRISFYAPCPGQEASMIGSALALNAADWAFPSYREAGVCLTRGMTLETLFDQLVGNRRDLAKGRQMPNHWASQDLRILSISSCIATQIPQAAGSGMAQKFAGEGEATICYFGDGATSEGDFHAGLNFAGVYDASTVFLCQNNQWAITLPVTAQTKSQTIAIKARAYGFPGVRVDGNDLLAVYTTVHEALERARRGEGPTLIEALTFRMGAHSTSDDPRRYREDAVVESWRKRDPIERLESYLITRGIVTKGARSEIEAEVELAVRAAIDSAEAVEPPPPESMFEDIYAERTPRLEQQQRELMAHLDSGVVKRLTRGH